MKRNTSFVQTLISNYEGTPQLQKIELKRQKKNLSISQAINDYNLTKARQCSFNNKTNHYSSSNILNSPNYNSNNPKPNYANKTTRTKPSISSIPIQKYKSKAPESKVIPTGENIPLNLLEIISNENDKALLFKYKKYNNEKDIDSILFKIGTIRLNLLSQYIHTCLNVISDYKTILNQPIIKSIERYENGIIIQKQLFNMKKYICNYIKSLPENKKNEQTQEYLKFLQKEIDIAKKLGVDSDSFEINYLFNIFPKGIDIFCDYDMFECVYYNSKKNNKISGKALIPPPEFSFKLDPDKIAIKFFDFEFDIEDLDDIKHILSQIWRIIQDKIKVAKLFIEPCLSQARIEFENAQNEKQREKEKEKEKEKDKKNKKNSESKFHLIENIKKKNNIVSLNTKTNTTENTLTNNINENKTMNNNMVKIIGKKNYTYTTENLNINNNNIIKNLESHFNSNKIKNIEIIKDDKIKKEDKKEEIFQIMKEDNEIENEDKKTDTQNEQPKDVRNVLNDLDNEKNILPGNENEIYKNENSGMNIKEDIHGK